MKPLCVSLRGIGRRDPETLSNALRFMADLVSNEHGHRYEDIDPHTEEIRRRTSWISGKVEATIEWTVASNASISFVIRRGYGHRDVTLRHPALVDMEKVETDEGLGEHIHMLADLVRRSARMDDGTVKATLSVFDGIVDAIAVLASVDPDTTRAAMDGICAPSPFREECGALGFGPRGVLRTTEEFDVLMRSKVPMLVQLKRNGSRDLVFRMESMKTYFDTTQRSMAEVLRRMPLLGREPSHLLRWVHS